MRRGVGVVFKDKGVVSLEEFDIDSLEPGRLLVKTLYTLISPGTETAFLLGLPNTPATYPQYPGYSNVGIVEDIASDIRGFSIGDIVASPSRHASIVAPRAENTFKIPGSIDPIEASFFYLSAIALQGVRKSEPEIGESAVVLGLGLVGQLTAQLLALCGVIPVIGVDLYDYRIEVARSLSIDYGLNPSKIDTVSEVYRITDGRGASIVIESTGNPEAINLALKLAGRRGRVILLGSTRGLSTVNFYSDVHRKGLIIIGAHNSIRPRSESSRWYWTIRDDVELVFKLLSMKRLRVRELISSILEYRQAEEAYKLLIDHKDRVISVVLDWRVISDSLR
ncbi:MAG: zinc-binding alcohol dehydrogenase [Candidatus Bathyarchaeia archaeon]|nr:zinc-binding alcohol dehydrogenase [Candidatus Bathyarchaeota archaeon]